MQRKIRVRGVRREELDSQQIAFVLWSISKRQVAEKRQREAAERSKRVTKESRRGR